MALSALIPIFLSLFMVLSLNRIWSLYLMMQLVSNIRNYKSLMIPSSANMALYITDNISNYRVVDQNWFKSWLIHSVTNNL